MLKVDVVEAAEKELRRRRHNEANARYRASLTPAKRAASQRRNRETKRRQRASLTEENRKEIKEHDRVYRVGKRKLERSGAIRFLPPIPDGPATETIYWGYWLEHDNPPVDLQKIVNDHPSERSAFQCSKCKLIFPHPKDARGHEYGIIGDLSNDRSGEHQRYWFKPPCQPSNNIIEQMKTCKRGLPVYSPSKFMVEEYLKENELLYPGEECGLDRTYKKLLRLYNIREFRNVTNPGNWVYQL